MSDAIQTELAAAWAAWNDAEDTGPMAAFVARHGELPWCDHGSPWCHRLGDVPVALAGGGAEWFRVTRCIQCGERLYLRGVGQAGTPERGVPTWLVGEKLMRWAKDDEAWRSENERGPGLEVDWEDYR